MHDLMLVAAGGAVGASIRYLLDSLIGVRRGFPLGLWVVNLLGSGGLGIVMGVIPPDAAARAFWGTGVCGALTTFSTFSVTTLGLLKERRVGLAVVHVVAHLAGGSAMFWAAARLVAGFA